MNFPLRFYYGNFKIFSKISNLNWFFGQTSKNLSLAFLISFGLIKHFPNFIKIPLTFIRIGVYKWEFARDSWKSSTFYRFPLIFRLIYFSIFTSFWAPIPEPPTNPYFQMFLKCFLHFRENFVKILKVFQKTRKIPLKIFIIIKFNPQNSQIILPRLWFAILCTSYFLKKTLHILLHKYDKTVCTMPKIEWEKDCGWESNVTFTFPIFHLVYLVFRLHCFWNIPFLSGQWHNQLIGM